jgi:anaerobic selenocysteine-containing dehydrogenase
VWVELHEEDARALGIGEGDLCLVTSPRGSVEAPARLTGKRAGAVFIPFHYGYWDHDDRQPDGHGTAANELTITAWDPVSKQPILKNAAVRVERR